MNILHGCACGLRGRAVVRTQARSRLLESDSFVSIQSLSLCGWDGRIWSGEGAGRTAAPRCSHVEAFAAATRSLDVGVVEDEFAREL